MSESMTQWAQDVQTWSRARYGEALTDEQIKAMQYAGICMHTDMRVVASFTDLLMSWVGAPKAFYSDMDRSTWADQVSYEIADNVLIVLVAKRIGPVDERKRIRSYMEMAEAANETENHTVAAVRAQAYTRAIENPDWTRQQIESAVWNGLLS